MLGGPRQLLSVTRLAPSGVHCAEIISRYFDSGGLGSGLPETGLTGVKEDATSRQPIGVSEECPHVCRFVERIRPNIDE